jgi:hypothetical protein
MHDLPRVTRQGITTPKGNRWLTTTLRSVLLSPRLAGYRVYRRGICLGDDGMPVKGLHAPIFTVSEWEELGDFLTNGEGRRHAQEGHDGGKIAIDGAKLDALITEYVLSYLRGVEVKGEAKPWPRQADLAVKEAKISELLEAYHADTLAKEDVFPAVAQLRSGVCQVNGVTSVPVVTYVPR